jgi:hypothetical protein
MGGRGRGNGGGSDDDKHPLVLSADVPRVKHIAHKRMGYLKATCHIIRDTVSGTEKNNIALVKLHITMCVRHNHSRILQLDGHLARVHEGTGARKRRRFYGMKSAPATSLTTRHGRPTMPTRRGSTNTCGNPSGRRGGHAEVESRKEKGMNIVMRRKTCIRVRD